MGAISPKASRHWVPNYTDPLTRQVCFQAFVYKNVCIRLLIKALWFIIGKKAGNKCLLIGGQRNTL